MRLFLAIRAFFAILFGQTLPPELLGDGGKPEATNSEAEGKVVMLENKLKQTEAELKSVQETAAELTAQAEAPVENTDAAAAVQVLAVMQSEARLLDFVSEDISDYSDEEVGAAVRDVHRGLQAAIKDHFPVTPVRSEEEDSPITVPDGFDPYEIRLVGNVIGEPPFSGTLNHRGWCVEKVNLPNLPSGKAAMIATPAEVEV